MQRCREFNEATELTPRAREREKHVAGSGTSEVVELGKGSREKIEKLLAQVSRVYR